MAFCNQCGTQLPDGARFCASCGAPVPGASATPETEAGPLLDKHAGAPPPTMSYGQSGSPMTGGRAPASGGMGWVLPLLVGIAVLAIAYLLFAPRPTVPGSDGGMAVATGSESGNAGAAPAANGAARGSVSAAVLDSAFNSDPAGAAARYAGPIRVSGTIATMVQPGPSPSLSMEGRTRFNFMVVNFPDGYRERLAPLSKGQFITVSCDEVRGFAGTTILSGCLLG